VCDDQSEHVHDQPESDAMSATRTSARAGARSGQSRPGPLMEFVHRRRRGAELFLLILSLFVGLGAYAAVGLGVDGQVPADIMAYGTWLAVLVIAAHVVIRLRAAYADPIILPIVSAINGLGLAMIYRIHLAQPDKSPPARTQLVWMTLGVLLFIAVLVGLRDHRRLQAFTYTAGLASILLLLLPLVPGLGRQIHGARIWVHLGPMSFQPGEIAKVLLVIAFAGYLVLHRDALALAGRRVLFVDLPRGRDLGPIMAMWLVSLAILVFQNDLGSSLLFFGIFLVMLYVATERPGWLVVGSGLFMAGAYFSYLTVGHVTDRVDVWLDPFHEGRGYQIVQGMYGMAWGGLAGRGLGQGSPDITPFGYSDFIASSIGEELGLTGLMAVIVLYGILVERGLRTALICRDNFGKLVAAGLAVVFALQVFVVIGGVTKLIPLTGLTTPFLSYGGSSLVANWIIMALILRVSDHARRPVPDLRLPTPDEETQVVRMR
jgi:cell division protein FtsW (lipid II flippase)